MNTKLALTILITLSMSACRFEVVDHDFPEIESFDIVDSYNTNSEFEHGPYAISPYLADGVFEVFWSIDSYHPYRAELFLNDTSTPDFGIKISSDWCGPGEPCGRNSYQFCRYRSNLSMVCELPESYTTYREQDVSTLFNGIPEDLYLVLEVCNEDLLYCEYQSLPVTLE